MAKSDIKPNIVLTLTTNNLVNIPIIITKKDGTILTATHINRLGLSYYQIRKQLNILINELISKYCVDTILIEQNQLFIDKIERYPDPYVLRDIKLGFGIQVMLEDNFWEKVKYILEIPRYEWKKEILNSKVDYAIDLYKNHIKLHQNLSDEFIKQCDDNNYYEALCLSECILCSKFLRKKYQINI